MLPTCSEQLLDHHMEMRAARDVDAEEILHLAGGDQQRGTGGEADHHGMRDEIDQHAHARQAQDQLEQAGEEGQGQHHADELRRAGFGERAHRGEYRDGNRGGRAGNQMPAGAEQGGDDGRHHGGIQAVFRRHAGDGGEGHALRQHDHRAGDAGDQVGLVGVVVDHRPPAQKGKNLVKPELAGKELFEVTRGLHN